MSASRRSFAIAISTNVEGVGSGSDYSSRRSCKLNRNLILGSGSCIKSSKLRERSEEVN